MIIQSVLKENKFSFFNANTESVGKNCTLLQILVCGLACAICKCVQCALASLTVPKGRSGWAKTIFFLHQPLINEPI